MVKKLSKFFMYVLFFIFALIIFAPKASLYFLLEENLKKFDIVVSDESLEDKFFSLELTNLNVTVKGVESAHVEEADVTIFLLFNNIELQNIELSSLVDSFMPAKIDTIKLSYTLFNPLVVKGEGNGEFGKTTMNLNLLSRELKLLLKPSKKMLHSYQNSLKMFKKDTNGEYSYAKTFK